MPEDGENASASKKSSSKDDRPIDNMQLAELLRESAKFVEEGKFDPCAVVIDFQLPLNALIQTFYSKFC